MSVTVRSVARVAADPVLHDQVPLAPQRLQWTTANVVAREQQSLAVAARFLSNCQQAGREDYDSDRPARLT